MTARTILAALSIVLTLTACSSQDTAAPPSTAVTPPTMSTPNSASATDSPSAAAPAVATDPWTEYYKLVGPLEPTLTEVQLKAKFDQAVKMFCPGGRSQMENLKNLASNPPGLIGDKATAANQKAATSIGALWEFGCGKGHDDALYTPLAASGTKSTAKTSWPCEPGYPNCTHDQSIVYQAKKCTATTAGAVWNETDQRCMTRDEVLKIGASSKSKEEYCRKTGQPLATCKAG